MNEQHSLHFDQRLMELKTLLDAHLGEHASKPVSLLTYLPEDFWLSVKKQGLLAPFLPVEYGGINDQLLLQETLRLAGHYGTAITLRTGIEGGLVIQPLARYGKRELVEQVLPLILNGPGGGLAITEPDVSGSAIARQMQSSYEILENGKIHLQACKYWQGNSQNAFLIVAARERKKGRLQKHIDLLFVPSEFIEFTPLETEGLLSVRYAVNRMDCELPGEYLISLAESPQKKLREFQNLFIRSRLQFIGMTQGILERIQHLVSKYPKPDLEFVRREQDEINIRQEISTILYQFVCENIKTDGLVGGYLLEANIIKSMGSELTYQAALIGQKLMGAKGYEKGHPVSQTAIDFRPFTIFEGPNEMLFSEVFDQFVRLGRDKKIAKRALNQDNSWYGRWLEDSRFSFPGAKANLATRYPDLAAFLREQSLGELSQVEKVFGGRILAKLFIMGRTTSERALRFLLREIRKDIVDFRG